MAKCKHLCRLNRLLEAFKGLLGSYVRFFQKIPLNQNMELT